MYASPRLIHFSDTETTVAAATEVEITGVPLKGVIRAVECVKKAGSCTTLAPVLGCLTNPGASTTEGQLLGAVAAAKVLEVPVGGIPYDLNIHGSTSLFLRMVPDAAADNTVYWKVAIEPET